MRVNVKILKMLWNAYNIYYLLSTFQNDSEIKTSGCTYWGSKVITINLFKIGVLPIVLTLMKFFIFTKIGHVIFQTHFNALLRTFQNQRTLRTFRQKLTHFTTRVTIEEFPVIRTSTEGVFCRAWSHKSFPGLHNTKKDQLN